MFSIGRPYARERRPFNSPTTNNTRATTNSTWTNAPIVYVPTIPSSQAIKRTTGDGVQHGALSLSRASSTYARDTGGGDSRTHAFQHAAIADACLCVCEQVHRTESLARGQPNLDRMTLTCRLNDDDENDRFNN